jgi:cation:H+ antiporter
VSPALLDLLLLVGGLALLTYAADRFVLGAARLSTIYRISPVIIGAIVIGFGTSAPEFVVTIIATLQGSQDLAFGNVVGSNTANMLLVVGAAGLVTPLSVASTTLRRELPLMLVAIALLTVATFNRTVTTPDALLLLAGAVVVIGIIVKVGLSDKEAAAKLEAEAAELGAGESPRTGSTALLTVLGLLGTLAGAQLLVTGATGVAEAIGLSQAVIGLTVVAIGTSLPELVTAVAAARRGEADLVVGNVLGSNIFNALPVAGVAGILDTVTLDEAFVPNLAFMVGACLLAAVFLRSGSRVSRVEGGVLLVVFAGVTAFTVLALNA